MPWYYYVAHFFAGAFAANGVPHFVQGICGNRFQTPFASPPGVGESSAVVNVAWGWINFVIAGVLVLATFPPLPPPIGGCVAGVLGALASCLWLAHHFGKVRAARHRFRSGGQMQRMRQQINSLTRTDKKATSSPPRSGEPSCNRPFPAPPLWSKQPARGPRLGAELISGA